MDKKLIDLYPYRVVDGKPEFLLFKRAKGKIYQDQWRMIGGKVEAGETYWQAALRELKEETGLSPVLFWTLPSLNSFYEHRSDLILQIPAFAAEISQHESPELDEEHTSFDWFSPERAEGKVPWPEQKRLLKLTNSLITQNKILDDWIVNIPS